jgi:hypothetical protein
MEKELYWVLYGLGVGFGFQVAYDAIGLFTNQVLKVFVGLFIYGIFAVFLLVTGRNIKKK